MKIVRNFSKEFNLKFSELFDSSVTPDFVLFHFSIKTVRSCPWQGHKICTGQIDPVYQCNNELILFTWKKQRVFDHYLYSFGKDFNMKLNEKRKRFRFTDHECLRAGGFSKKKRDDYQTRELRQAAFPGFIPWKRKTGRNGGTGVEK